MKPDCSQTGEHRTPKRVLMATSSYPFHPEDFRALFVHEMAVALAEQGVQVRVLTPSAEPEATGMTQHDGIEILRFSYPGLAFNAFRLTGNDGIWQNILNKPARLLAIPGFLLAFTLALQTAKKRFQPDGVITHWLLPTSLSTSLAFFFSRTPMLHLGHGSDVHLLSRLPGRSAIVRLLNWRGVVVATSPFIQKKIRTFYTRKPVPVNPLGVRGTASPKRDGFRQPIKFCFMGRIVRGKGLYRALACLGSRPEWSLSIAGEGSEMARLQKHSREKGLSVTFHPPVLGRAKSAFLKQHDYFLFIPEIVAEDAFQDNLPVSLLEALRHGLPVIATGLLGLRSVFRENELIFVDGSPRSIHEAIEGINEAAHARLCREAYRTGLRFSWDSSIEKILQLMQQHRK